ncbi:MAG: DedA family protein [Paludibacteraceae bacterium]|nr:DedA family protein [Paludibacteraceae bacterium]
MKKTLFILSFLFLTTVAFTQTIQQADNAENESIFKKIENWYGENMNYFTVTALMTIESSFIPFPSEIVIPPAAFVASNEESSLNISDSYVVNILLIVLFGTIGSLLGAIINYLLAIWLGRPIIYKFADSRFGRICLLSSEKIKHAEDYFNQHGKVSTFIGRLIPGIRQLISIPAGLAKMNFIPFIIYTTLGAGIWNVVLATLGYIAHGQMDLINKYSHEVSMIILIIMGLIILYFIGKKILKRKRQ